MEMKGKRLLVTGGSNFAKDIFAFTKPRGIQVIATGNSHNPLMDSADECYSVDTRDVEALKTLCREAKIDGIFAGGNEPNIVTAIQVTEQLGMPYYCTMEQWEQLMNKANYKKLCREFGVPVTKEYGIRSLADVDTVDISYPVVVKPVDSCGSNGVVFCADEKSLRVAITDALEFSVSKTVIVEQYVTGEEINAVYTICNGKITLSCLNEKYPVAEQSGLRNMPSLLLYPSKHLSRYLAEVNPYVIAMMEHVGLRYGTVFMQGFANDSGIYMFEAGLRPSGGANFRYTQMMNNVNHLNILIEQALTGTVSDDPNARDNPDFAKVCGAFTMCSGGGRVSRIEGLDLVGDIGEIQYIDCFYQEGDTVPPGTTLAQRVIRFHLRADSIPCVAEAITKIQNRVRVLNENGESILFRDFDVARLGC